MYSRVQDAFEGQRELWIRWVMCTDVGYVFFLVVEIGDVERRVMCFDDDNDDDDDVKKENEGDDQRVLRVDESLSQHN